MLRIHVPGCQRQPLFGVSVVMLAAVLGCPPSLRAASILHIGGGPDHSPVGLCAFAGTREIAQVRPFTTASALLLTMSSPSASMSEPFINCTGIADGGHGASISAPAGMFWWIGDAAEGIGAGERSLAAFNLATLNPGSLASPDLLGVSALDLDVTVRFGGFEEGTPQSISAAIVPLPPTFVMGAVGLLGVIVATTITRRTIL